MWKKHSSAWETAYNSHLIGDFVARSMIKGLEQGKRELSLGNNE
jgi:hypothetical protein